jgi:hypothetical protein
MYNLPLLDGRPFNGSVYTTAVGIFGQVDPASYRIAAKPPSMVFNHPDGYQIKPGEAALLDQLDAMLPSTIDEANHGYPTGTLSARSLDGPTRKKLMSNPNAKSGHPQFDFLMTVKATFEHLANAEKFIGDARSVKKRAYRFIPHPSYTHYGVAEWLTAHGFSDAAVRSMGPASASYRLDFGARAYLDPPVAGNTPKAIGRKTADLALLHQFPVYHHIDALSQGLYRLFTSSIPQLRDMWSNQRAIMRRYGWFDATQPDNLSGALGSFSTHTTILYGFQSAVFAQADSNRELYGCESFRLQTQVTGNPMAALGAPTRLAYGNAGGRVTVIRFTSPGLWPRHGGPVSQRVDTKAPVVLDVGDSVAELAVVQPRVRDFFKAVRKTGLIRYLLGRLDSIVQAFYNANVLGNTDLVALDMLKDGSFQRERLATGCGPGMQLRYLDSAGVDVKHKDAVIVKDGKETLSALVASTECIPAAGGFSASGRLRAGSQRLRSVVKSLSAYRAVVAKRKKRSSRKSRKSRKGRKKRSSRKSRKSRKGRKKRSSRKGRKKRSSRKGRKKRSGRKSRRGHTALSSNAFAKCKRLLKREALRGRRSRRKGRKSRRGLRKRSRRSKSRR